MITARNILGFSVTQNMQRIMSINGHYASIMRAEKQTKSVNKLPAGIPIPVLPVDYLINKPDFWIGGEGSYVCPIESDWALWFNWSMNSSNTAVLSSVKGMNPITGQRINGIGLEQYHNKCPIHNCEFLHGKFCPECNFKWPDQNYICDPSPMYLDGFRSEDGTVRQFYFTEDMTKSIPELVIGKEDTVPAFGFCFYKLQNDNRIFESGNRLKDIPQESNNLISKSIRASCMSTDTVDGCHFSGTLRSAVSTDFSKKLTRRKDTTFTSSIGETKLSADSSVRAFYSNSSGSALSADNSAGSICYDSFSVLGESVLSERPKDLEVGIGAGVQIKQSFYSDKRDVKEWNEKSSGIIRVYFVFREQFEQCVSVGLKDLTGQKEGFLTNLPVGA